MTPHRTKELSAMLELVEAAEAVISNPCCALDDFGRLLDDGWRLKNSLTSRITNVEIDDIYAAGIGAGALGGKLLGAGGGAFMLFFVPPQFREKLRHRLKGLLCVPFSFSHKDSQVVVYEPEETYDRSLSEARSLVYA